MREVTCSACDNYRVIYEHTTDKGFCIFCEKIVYDEDKVCEEYVLRRGLYTKRTIPSYCKNYHKEK